MLPDEVRKAERDPQLLSTGPTKWRAEHCVTHHYACDCREWEHACELEKWQDRCERAEALLRDASRYLDPRHYSQMIGRITAHLSENSRGNS